MSLPDGFIEDLRNRLSLGQVVGRKVVWDNRKSNQAKGDLWAPCPFHQEKSASFHVDDRKGFYYCFGCHAKGDAISFVRETENASFMEAIEILAREAGMEMPAQDPAAAARASKRAGLSDIMELAVQFYRLQLKTGAAEEARTYLAGRGLKNAALARWEIGFAGNGRRALAEYLAAKGVDEAQAVLAGLIARPDNGGPCYDRFRGRIMFPIRDGRSKAIAFGGRAMDPNARAKYLNSPETPLFDKGRSLYNHAPARVAAGKGQQLIMCEGYMDVIALSEAGMEAAVAPLGTAVTEEQLRLLWRIHPEPVVALDGDKAGMRAALRVIDIALPIMEAGQALRFATLPEGQDPDDLIRSEGAAAMQAVIATAQPMIRLLWERETEGQVLDSPERRAVLDKKLRAVLQTIKDPSLKSHYSEEVRRLRRALFAPPRHDWQAAMGARRGGKKGNWQPPVRAGTKNSILAGAGTDTHLHEAVILAIIIKTPQMLTEFEHQIEQMECQSSANTKILDAILRYEGGPEGLRAAIDEDLGPTALEKLFSSTHVAIAPAIRRTGNTELARLSLVEELAKLQARRGHAEAVSEAVEDIDATADEWLTKRLGEAAASVDVTRRHEASDVRDTVTADNGLAMDKEERGALDDLISKIRAAKDNESPSD
ncbi:MAG: DNA primase [Rhodobacteraceae bacterium]|nr:DNA primase [Paracoccaceae bacterium]